MSTNSSDRKMLSLLKEKEILSPENPEFEIITTDSSDAEVFNTVSGTYNGTEFVVSTDNTPFEQEVLVGGQLILNGLSEPLPCTFSFKSTRYLHRSLFEEHLQIISSKGCLFAIALYEDVGTGYLSNTSFADYTVQTCFGELRQMKGMNIRITFNNVDSKKTRTISLVRGFGSSAEEADLIPN